MPARVTSVAQPTGRTLAAVRDEARDCRACDLWKLGTQTVFGEGPARAPLMLVGEQPGDREDLSGHPFVGPAGRLLDGALAAAGIDRRAVYVTNVVKHFKWAPRGKARIHKKPNGREVAACRPWLERELQLVRPTGVLCLAATAAQALLGSRVRVTVDRGRVMESDLAAVVMVTVHPSSLLRAPSDADRERELGRFVEHLQRFAAAVEEAGRATRSRRRA
jgi:uracil-DNA glycosylase family protein